MEAELWAEIRRLHLRERWPKKKVARHLHVDPKTVRRAIGQARYEPQARAPREPRPSKLDPFKETVRAILETFPDLSVERIHEKLCSKTIGYTGGIAILRRFVWKLRPRKPAEAFLRIAFPPGDAAQVDWGSCGTIVVDGRPRRLSAFVFVLCASRFLYVEFTLTEQIEVFLACHENALAAIAGVPRRILYDNLRAVVLAHVGSEVRLNPRFVDFSAHYGFKPVACAPYRPNEKGRVENAVKYLKNNFLAGRDLKDLDTANREVRRWLEETANVREHATTHRRPADELVVERPLFGPLPPTRYDTRVLKTVRASPLCRVQFDSNTYSVPPSYAGSVLTLKASATEVAIYAAAEEVARHARVTGRYQDVVDPDHVRALKEKKNRAHRGVLVQRFLALGAEAEPYLAGLVRVEVSLYIHLKRILALADRYGRSDVVRALAHAAAHGAFGADYVERIVHEDRRRRRAGPPPAPLSLTHAPDLAKVTLPEIDLDLYDRAFGTGATVDEEGPGPREAPPGKPGQAWPHPHQGDLFGPDRPGDEGGALVH